MREAEASGRAAEEGLAIAHEITASLRGLVQGVQIEAPRRAVAPVLSLLDVLR